MRMQNFSDVDAYLKQVNPEMRPSLEKLRTLIHRLAPEASESISYGMPAYKYKGKPLVYFAAFKNHMSFFPASGSVLKLFEEELQDYVFSKGTIRFTTEKPLTDALLEKIISMRMKENEMLEKNKKKKP